MTATALGSSAGRMVTDKAAVGLPATANSNRCGRPSQRAGDITEAVAGVS